MLKIKIGVVFGGKSVEHEISILSALQAMYAINKDKYEIIPMYISKDGIWYTGDLLLDLDNYKQMDNLLSNCNKIVFSANANEGKMIIISGKGISKRKINIKRQIKQIDLFFPVIHGTHGEDGCLQGFLELTGLPYIGFSVLGSAIGMDKIAMKAILAQAGLPLVKYDWFYDWEWEQNQPIIINALETRIGYPMVVKPANLGSSIGISKTNTREQLVDAILIAAKFSQRIVVEQMIQPLREINCSVLGTAKEAEVSACEEPIASDDILSYDNKYLSGNAKGLTGLERRIPADISSELEAVIKRLALRTFRILDGNGVCRIDFLLDKDKNVYVNEINTIPGSLSFYLWEACGKSFPQLIDDLVRIALKREREKSKRIFSHNVNLLSSVGVKSGIIK